MQQADNKSKVFSGLIWKFGERIAAQLVTFIVSVILARLLDPSSYGAIAIVNIFIAIAEVFVCNGIGNSLIQKKDADDMDFSSAFYVNMLLSVVLYLIVFIFAPYIADFYKLPILSPVLRFLGIKLIIAGVNSIQNAYVSRHMIFKRFFWSTLGGTIGSAVVGIAMAYMGFGIWALAGQYMFNSVIATIVLWFTIDWKPQLLFSLHRVKGLFSFGWKILVSALLDSLNREIRSLVIGRVYTPSDLAYYNKGSGFPNLVVTNVNSSIQSVMFPAIANVQDDKVTVKNMMRRAIRVSSYIMFPLMMGLMLIAEPFVRVLLTDKWLGAVPFLQIYCIVYLFMPIHTSNLQAIKALGRSDIYLKLEVIKKIVGIVLLIISIRFGVIAIALSGLVSTLISSVINSYPNKKLIGYGYFEQIKDLFNGFIPLIIMVIIVVLTGIIKLPDLPRMAIQVLVGFVIYVAMSYLFKNESFDYILGTIKGILKKS